MVSLSCNGSFRTEHPRGEAVANVSCRNVKLSQRGCSVRVEQKIKREPALRGVFDPRMACWVLPKHTKRVTHLS